MLEIAIQCTYCENGIYWVILFISQFKEKVTGLLLNYFIDSHNSDIYAIDRYNSIIPLQQSLLLLSIEPWFCFAKEW